MTQPQVAISSENPSPNMKVVGALAIVYLVWGSTYLGIAFALESFSPFMTTALRLWLAGSVIFAFALSQGEHLPSRRLMANAVLIGCLTLAAGTSSASIGVQYVSSGLAALAIAVVPLYAAVFAALMYKRPTKVEWLGLIIGFSGIVLLNSGGSLRAEPIGAIALTVGPMLWSFGSILSQRIELPKGWMAIAFEMLGAAVLLTIITLMLGDIPTETPTLNASLAILYLGLVGSLLGFSAYMYLLRTVRPALATSYAYVNPVVAIILGITIAGEVINRMEVMAMVIILTGVIIVVSARSDKKKKA